MQQIKNREGSVEQLMPALILWIASVTGWQVPAARPDIQSMSPEISARLGGMAYVSFVPSIGPHGTIFTRQGAEESDLVHELVHFYQQEQGREARTAREECLVELEAEHIENLHRRANSRPESRPFYELCGRFVE